MIYTIRTFLASFFLPNLGKLKIDLPKPQLNLAEKITLLFNTSKPEQTKPQISELQELQSASLGAKVGALADLGLGTIPTLAIDTSCVVSGMYLRKQKPVLGYGMIGYGLTDNLLQAIYPLKGIFSTKSSSDHASNTSQLINGAIGLPGHIATLCTSAFLAAIVPFAGFLSYKHSRSLTLNSISDLAAIKHWVITAQTDPIKLGELQVLWNKYSQNTNTKALEKVCENLSQKTPSLFTKNSSALESKEVLDFIRFLLDNVPSKAIQQAKEEIFANQRKKLPDDPIQTTLAVAGIAGGIALVAEKILWMLTEGSFQAINMVITALTAISIVGLVASLLSSAYQTYQDFCAPNALVPQEAKMLSLARLVSNIATTALLTTALFVPGLNIFFIVTLALGAILSMYTNYKRSEIVQQRISLVNASQPETVKTMQALLKEHREQTEGTPMSSSLKKWVTLIKSDPATASLATV